MHYTGPGPQCHPAPDPQGTSCGATQSVPGKERGELSPCRRPSSDWRSGAELGYVPDSLERPAGERWKAGWVELSKHPNSYN